jgi:hypothetical protein
MGRYRQLSTIATEGAEAINAFLKRHAHPNGLTGIWVRERLSGGGNYANYTVKLTVPRDPNGLYLLKGRGPNIWQKLDCPGNAANRRASFTASVAEPQRISGQLFVTGFRRRKTGKRSPLMLPG